MSGTVGESFRVLCAGLPKAGKSTFLAALFHVAEGAELPCALTMREGTLFESDREYLQTQREQWLQQLPLERNKPGTARAIVLSLDGKYGERITLDIPDLAGEDFRQQVEERTLAVEMMGRYESCEALLLFVNPDYVREPSEIAETNGVLEAFEENPVAGSREAAGDVEQPGSAPALSADGSNGATVAAAPEPQPQPCTAVQLVELLQIVRLFARQPILRVQLVISAMDALDGGRYENNAELFVRERLSLVHQYLEANAAGFSFGVVGVSAQGGSYRSLGAQGEVPVRRTATERIRVSPAGHLGAHDITDVVCRVFAPR